MVDEREDGIERLRHEGHVHRWSRPDPQWPGHTSFVALKGGEAVLGDRYAGEGVVRTYACDLRSLLDGCFDVVIGEQLGARVLEELRAEARRELGEGAATGTKNLREAAASGGAAGSSAPASEPSPAKVVSARPAPAQTASVAPERPSAAVSVANSQSPVTAPATGAARVDLTVVACQSVGLPLAVALRGITRAPVQDLLGRLRSLPCRVAAGVPREHAEGLAARLSELGAEVRLVPAGGS